MRNWPPEIPNHGKMIGAMETLISGAKELALSEDLEDDERKIVLAMRPSNTTAGLAVAEEESGRERLFVLVETSKKIRFRAHKLLLSDAVEHFFALPEGISHAAVNGMRARHAEALGDLLVRDFLDTAEEQYEFAESVGAPKSELKKISVDRFAGQLQKLHRMIQEGALPIKRG